jgi:hypothetical protein
MQGLLLPSLGPIVMDANPAIAYSVAKILARIGAALGSDASEFFEWCLRYVDHAQLHGQVDQVRDFAGVSMCVEGVVVVVGEGGGKGGSTDQLFFWCRCEWLCISQSSHRLWRWGKRTVLSHSCLESPPGCLHSWSPFRCLGLCASIRVCVCVCVCDVCGSWCALV